MNATRVVLAEMSNTACQAGEFNRMGSKLVPRVSSSRGYRSVRATNSQPNLVPHRRMLKPQPSKLDLLDQNLTFFPAVDSVFEIIDDYFPTKPSPLVKLDPPARSWVYIVHRKLRWRWRLNGLFHT